MALLLMLLCSPAAAAPDPATDPRMDDAWEQLWSGDAAAAARLWRELLDEARVREDPAAIDRARSALAVVAFQEGRYEAFETLQRQRLAAAARDMDLRIAADARMELALLDRRRGLLPEAQQGLQEAIEAFRALRDRDGEGTALTHLGLVLLNLGQFAQAMGALDEALALQRAGADVPTDRTYHYLGLLYHRMNDLPEARAHLERGLEKAQTLPDPMRAAALLGSLARLANDEGRHEEALDHTTRSHAIAVQSGSVPGLAYSALERGRALLGLGRLDEARQVLQEAHRLSRSIAQDRTAADAMFSLGRVALQQGETELALQRFAQALPNYESANDVPQTLDAYRLVIPLLRERGDLAGALRLAETALELQDQLSGRDINRRVALIEYRHHAADNARQIELLTHENEIQQLRLARQAQQRRFGIALSVGLAVVTLLLAWGFGRSRRISRELAISNRELKRNRLALTQAHQALQARVDTLAVAANTDTLTGLANRRQVLTMLSGLIEQRRALAVLLLDVDRFKSINDQHGHGTGDRVLQEVARILAAQVPEGGLLARYGGEEFLLVLPEHDLEHARRFAEQARAAVEAWRAPELPAVTLSIGVTARAADDAATSLESLIEQADRALYRAKESGRNRVETSLRVA